MKRTTVTPYFSSFMIPLFLTVLPSAAQNRAVNLDRQSEARRLMDKAVARQKSAVTAMESSIAAQRTPSKQRGAGTTGRDSFFSLPPLERTLQPTPAMPACEAMPSSEVDSLIQQVAGRAGLMPSLVRSVMKQESGFHSCAVSVKGAMGLMQLMPSTAAEMGVLDPFNPKENALGGARLLRRLMDSYGGNVSLALSAYNAGKAKVDATMGIPKIRETQDYVHQVLSLVPGFGNFTDSQEP